MSNIVQFPVIAGIEITTDEHGRFNLNALHKAGDSVHTKRPSIWLATKQAQELVSELSQNSGLGYDAISSVKGGTSPGTFAHELLAIEYAGWISPRFRLQVNQTFLDYRTGKLKPTTEMSKLEILQLAMDSEKERMRLEAVNQELLPKAQFHDRVSIAQDAISISEAAKTLGTGRNRLLAILRKIGWVTRRNEPYQSTIAAGLMDVKIGSFEHPEHGLKQSITPLFTGKGLVKIQSRISMAESA